MLIKELLVVIKDFLTQNSTGVRVSLDHSNLLQGGGCGCRSSAEQAQLLSATQELRSDRLDAHTQCHDTRGAPQQASCRRC